jgi:hypothetical protein
MAKAAGIAVVLLAALVAAKFLAGCSPFSGADTFACETDDQCQGGADGHCEANHLCSFLDENRCGPGGHSYGSLSGSLSGTCVGSEPPMEAGIDAPDAPRPEAGEECFGSAASLVQPCFSTLPSGTMALPAVIDTDGALCQASGVSNTNACVIAAGTITVDAGTTVVAKGSRPLVIVATTAVMISGTLDVASHRGVVDPGPAANDGGCDAGTPPTTSGGAGGGGAGGAYGGTGGNGGGGNGGGANGGATGAIKPAALHGGCHGQTGADGTVAMRGGGGGSGGGVVYVLSRGTIAILTGGVIDASGAGATNGVTGTAGGGGGGSGGLIGLDAPTVTNAGVVFANGGSGAEGSGVNGPGQPGNDPIGIAAATPAPPGSANGGDGGNGGAGNPGNGSPGSMSTDGGGGGGGVGYIKVVPLQAIGGMLSPPPS